MPTIRGRFWCLTVNNPREGTADAPKPSWEYLQYYAYQLEQGEGGTLHYQCFIAFNRTRTFRQVRLLCPRGHWEVRSGNSTNQQAIDYCTKEDTRVSGPWFYGQLLNERERTDIQRMYSMVKKGKTDLDIQEEMVDCYVGHLNAPTKLRNNLLEGSKRTEPPTVKWFWGPTGSGKTRTAFEQYPDAYFKDMSDGKWWDGYAQQECVIFDDMRKDTFKFHELLRILDRYPLRVQMKGSSCQFNSKVIIITSCFPPETLYETREDVGQLLRRINEIVIFPIIPEPPLPNQFVVQELTESFSTSTIVVSEWDEEEKSGECNCGVRSACICGV